MDIAEFNIIRAARNVDNGRVLRLTDRVTISPLDSVKSRRELAPIALSLDALPSELGNPTTDPLGNFAKLTDPSVLACTYEIVHQMERRLAASNDRVAGIDLAKLVTVLAKRFELQDVDWTTTLGPGADLTTLFRVARLGYRSALAKSFRPRQDFERAVELCRHVLVASLLDTSVEGLDVDQVFDLVNRRAVVLVGMTIKQLTSAPPRIKLIRDAKVADLQVVRREWAGYLAGEIANIRNVMSGERFEQHERTTHEVDTTVTTSSETSQLTESEDQTKLSSELSQEVNSQLGVTINGHADASAEFKYPIVTARVSGGVDAGLSLQRSERQASKIARESVNRALTRIDSVTRESRTRRELTRTKQGMDYALQNTTGENVHGVYRWVDRVDTYQLFRYADRFLLEFEIPEPAEFYRWRTSRTQTAAGTKDKPPEWDVKAAEITAKNLISLAAKYRASNLPPPPDHVVSVVRTITAELGKESVPDNPGNSDVLNPPTATKEVEIPVPTDYVATTVRYEGEGYPVLAWWVVPDKTQNNPSHQEGYHSAFATVSIGGESKLYWNGGDTNTTHGTGADVGTVKELQTFPAVGSYGAGAGLLSIGAGSGRDPDTVAVKLEPPAVNLVKIALSTVGMISCSLTLLVECTLTKEALTAWELSVYDALYAAWAQWKKDSDSSLMQTLLGSAAADAGSSQRNEQIIREELKREAISWLLDEPGFAGRPGLKTRPISDGKETSFADIDFDVARRDAPTIQFLEQAFEWTNLSYFFYPYYWAKRSDWEERAQLVANDPDFERFLRSGSARVIVPARPGFEDAVRNWLIYTTPFISGQLPAPDDNLYISLDTEIREITSPWEGGIAGESWQSRVGTTLLYLEKEGDLPFTNDKHELPAPEGTLYKQKPIIAFP